MRHLPSLRTVRSPRVKRHEYAFRLLTNDHLQRNLRELLKRPVGRQSRQPVGRYKSFLYQAATGLQVRRVVANCPALVVEAHHRSVVACQVRQDKPDAGQ